MSSAPPDGSPPVLGWRERADLPLWGISGLRVKLDTGAKTSAIHAVDVREAGSTVVDGHVHTLLRFDVPLDRHPDGPRTQVDAPLVGYRSIRDSRARAERRPVVRTRLVCGSVIDAEVDLALTDRVGMLYRVILGRRALEGRAVVDPARSYTAASGPRRARVRPHDLT